MIKPKESLLGVRVAHQLKKKLDHYCRQTGVSRKHFVEKAIQEKLMEVLEQEQDAAIAKKRLVDSEVIDEKTMIAYLTKRLEEK